VQLQFYLLKDFFLSLLFTLLLVTDPSAKSEMRHIPGVH